MTSCYSHYARDTCWESSATNPLRTIYTVKQHTNRQDYDTDPSSVNSPYRNRLPSSMMLGRRGVRSSQHARCHYQGIDEDESRRLSKRTRSRSHIIQTVPIDSARIEGLDDRRRNNFRKYPRLSSRMGRISAHSDERSYTQIFQCAADDYSSYGNNQCRKHSTEIDKYYHNGRKYNHNSRSNRDDRHMDQRSGRAIKRSLNDQSDEHRPSYDEIGMNENIEKGIRVSVKRRPPYPLPNDLPSSPRYRSRIYSRGGGTKSRTRRQRSYSSHNRRHGLNYHHPRHHYGISQCHKPDYSHRSFRSFESVSEGEERQSKKRRPSSMRQHSSAGASTDKQNQSEWSPDTKSGWTKSGTQKLKKDGRDDIIHFHWYFGMMLKENLQVVGQLGEGTFGRVLRCIDRERYEYVAVKVVRDVERYTIAAKIEAQILRDVNIADPEHQSNCVQLHDCFMYKNKHMCLVFESLGQSLFEFLSNNDYHGFFLSDIQKIAYQCLKALDFLRQLKLTHTDLKPENILLVSDDFEWVPVPRVSLESSHSSGASSSASVSHPKSRPETRKPSTYILSNKPSNWNSNSDVYDVRQDDRNTSNATTDYSNYKHSHLKDSAQSRSSVTDPYPIRILDPDPYSQSRSDHRSTYEDTDHSRDRWKANLTKRPKSIDVKLIDFGSATFEAENHSSLINTRQYRAPEVILDIGWSMESDVWSLGCILIELYTGSLLFKTHEHLEHLAMMQQLFGPIPPHMLNAASKTQGRKYLQFNRRSKLSWPEGASSDASKRRVMKCKKLQGLVLRHHKMFASFLSDLLRIDPRERALPHDALQHPFLTMEFDD